MIQFSQTSQRTLGAVLLLAASVALSACAGGTDTAPAPVTSTPQQHSPLAVPPSSMMTPHGY